MSAFSSITATPCDQIFCAVALSHDCANFTLPSRPMSHAEFGAGPHEHHTGLFPVALCGVSQMKLSPSEMHLPRASATGQSLPSAQQASKR